MSNRIIKLDTIKALLARSGNQCAYPNCFHPLFNDENLFVSQLCHIEAVSPGGPRYNSAQTNDQRNNYSNLLFLCYRHHKETDNEKVYSVEKLRKIKEEHENRFIEKPLHYLPIMVNQVKEEMAKYWSEVQMINSNDATELQMEVDTAVPFTALIDEVYNLVETVSDSLNDVVKHEDELYEKALNFFKTLGYNTDRIEVSSHNNPLINRKWELHNIGWPNLLNKLRLRLKQIEINYHEEYLTNNPQDNEIRQRLIIVMEEFKTISGTIGYYD